MGARRRWSVDAVAAHALLGLGLVALGLMPGCGPKPLPPDDPKPAVAVASHDDRPKQGGPAIEYDLGPLDPSVFKSRLASLKSAWNDCFHEVHQRHAFIEGKVTFTLRTRKDGSVKWAFIKESDLGSRAIEKCLTDSLKAQNYGPPMDAKEGEVPSHTYGWAIDDDDRAADPGAQGNVLPSVEKAKGRIDACRKGGKGRMIATLYVDKGGKPVSAGVAIDDPSLADAVDCVVDVLMSLKYVNKASWPTKTTFALP